MATSKIETYSNKYLIPENNFLFDSMTSVLGFSPIYRNDNFQYIQLEADITIKINVDQSKLTNQTLGNYCKIEQDGKTWYYFIVGSNWKSKKCVQLFLSLDSINTFPEIATNLGDKTIVYREHKNRNKIDNIPEGIQAVLYKNPLKDSMLLESGEFHDWFLIYKNHTEDTNAALDCFICTSDNIHIIADASSGYLDISLLKEGYTYIINGVLKVKGISYTATLTLFLVFRKINNKVEFNHYTDTGELESEQWLEITKNEDVVIESNPAVKGKFNTQLIVDKSEIYNSTTIMVPTIYESSYIKSIDDIDRTDLRLNKILRLPYCPVDYTYNSTTKIYNFDTTKFKYNKDENLLQLKDLNTKFSHTVIPNPAVNIFPTLEKSTDPSQLRNDKYESKLYSSEFYQPRFIYDEFVYTFALEDISEITDYNNIVFKYIHTSTVNSKSLIDFYNLKYERSTVDYPGYLIINRGEEEVIYSSPYINYIKNGYNYDKRNAWFNFATSLIGQGIGIGGGVINTLYKNSNLITQEQYAEAVEKMMSAQDTISNTPYYSSAPFAKLYLRIHGRELGRQYAIVDESKAIMDAYRKQLENTNDFSKATGISSIASSIGGIVGSIGSLIGSYISMEQQKEQTKNQAVSVSGADDIDLLKVYSKNKAKISTYELSKTMKELIGDLFYYTGYNAEGRQYKPDLYSRYHFNFIQCNPEFENKNALVNKYADDIRLRLQKGVTFFHLQELEYDDLDQLKENTEIENVKLVLEEGYYKTPSTSMITVYFDFVNDIQSIPVDLYFNFKASNGYAYSVKLLDTFIKVGREITISNNSLDKNITDFTLQVKVRNTLSDIFKLSKKED